MGRWLSLVGLGIVFAMTAGCGSGSTAAEIAESYGTLGHCPVCCVLSKSTVKVFESGQAETMVASGQASTSTSEKTVGFRRVLVTEYRIQGEVYKVEVRRAINPLKSVGCEKVRWFEYGPKDRTVPIDDIFSMMVVSEAIRNHSYEADGEAAYRAYRGSDGKVHGVRVEPLVKSGAEWKSDYTLDLLVRTKDWPTGLIWFKGLTSDNRHFATDCANAMHRSDGRWTMVAAGPGMTGADRADGTPDPVSFYNYKLHGVLQCLAGELRGYDTTVMD